MSSRDLNDANPNATTPQATPDTVESVARFVDGFSIETTPKGAAKIANFGELLKAGTKVYVTALPGSDFNETIATCIRLSREGMQPVPHFAARGIPSKQKLDEHLHRLTSEAGVRHVLALGGADREPAGEFEDSAAMLETGLFDRYGIQSIGIAGHPEGSPDIERLFLREFGQRKIRYADATGVSMYMVTQFTFEAAPVIEWVERIRGEGNRLPIVIGIPGPASLKSLIGHATQCGVGPSMKFLTKQARNVHKLLMLQTPDKLVRDLARQVATRPDLNIQAPHAFTLGAFATTAKWFSDVSAGRFTLDGDGMRMQS